MCIYGHHNSGDKHVTCFLPGLRFHILPAYIRQPHLPFIMISSLQLLLSNQHKQQFTLYIVWDTKQLLINSFIVWKPIVHSSPPLPPLHQVGIYIVNSKLIKELSATYRRSRAGLGCENVLVKCQGLLGGNLWLRTGKVNFRHYHYLLLVC